MRTRRHKWHATSDHRRLTRRSQIEHPHRCQLPRSALIVADNVPLESLTEFFFYFTKKKRKLLRRERDAAHLPTLIALKLTSIRHFDAQSTRNELLRQPIVVLTRCNVVFQCAWKLTSLCSISWKMLNNFISRKCILRETVGTISWIFSQICQ